MQAVWLVFVMNEWITKDCLSPFLFVRQKLTAQYLCYCSKYPEQTLKNAEVQCITYVKVSTMLIQLTLTRIMFITVVKI